MVRCGHCLQAFDARLSFIPSEPDPQLELPIAEPAQPSTVALPDAVPQRLIPTETLCYPIKELTPQDAAVVDTPAAPPASEYIANPVPQAVISARDLDFSQALTAPATSKAVPRVITPVIDPSHNQESETSQDAASAKPRTWLWIVSALLLLVTLSAQAIYFFRVDIAAHYPNLKPMLQSYSGLLGASVPLPHNEELMSIESSDLEADPNQENHITLDALLRNRASYAQAYPSLELTLNDDHDQPLARRTFKPSDYLPPVEQEATGLLANHELMVKLPLDTADLKPSGYRLVLFYPNK